MENYTSSMIELPPTLDNIYTTNDYSSSRFNSGTASSSVVALPRDHSQSTCPRRSED